MSNATADQIVKLRKFVGDQPQGWRVLERAGNWFAYAKVLVTDEYPWHLTLEPLEEDDSPYVIEGGFAAWKASCEKGDTMSSRRGSFAECVTWLDHKVAEWQRERTTAIMIAEFADARKGWQFIDRPGGKYYAGRRFEYETGERFLLSVLPHAPARRLSRFQAQINVRFAAGPEHAYIGDTIDQIEDWVGQWTKLLSVPINLADCDHDEARETVARLSASEVGSLSYLLDIEGSIARCRTELVRKYCPAARGSK